MRRSPGSVSVRADGGSCRGRLGRFGPRGLRPYADDRPIAQDLPRLLLQVRYIGPRRARRLVDALGGDWREVLDLAPERVFRTLRGVGQSQARAAAESWAVLSRETAPPRQGRRAPSGERPIA